MLEQTNVDKKFNTKPKQRRVYETLTDEERKQLRQVTIGHGNMAKCEDATRLFRATIMNAMAGGRLMPATAKTIRDYINVCHEPA
ncbi:hypothetical protein [Chitinophaga sp. YIM B06452]|uniref:hypothetical protein n=1 Tax=Chitinophaga sp. YIM B06452 TaxID=3082158 RepID=UPI0031FE642D